MAAHTHTTARGGSAAAARWQGRPTLVFAAGPFSATLSATGALAAAVRGLCGAGLPAPEGCSATDATASGRATSALLEELEFDRRLRASRALLLLAGALSPETLLGGLACEAATRARQAGVPAYAIAAREDLGLFGARVLDLQRVVTARGPRGVQSAAGRLAALI